MNAREWISFEEMLTKEQLDAIGLSQDRDLSQCIVRLALAYQNTVNQLKAQIHRVADLEAGRVLMLTDMNTLTEAVAREVRNSEYWEKEARRARNAKPTPTK